MSLNTLLIMCVRPLGDFPAGATMSWLGFRPTLLLGAMLVRRGDADAMLCGTQGNYAEHLKYVRNVIGLRAGVKALAATAALGRRCGACAIGCSRSSCGGGPVTSRDGPPWVRGAS